MRNDLLTYDGDSVIYSGYLMEAYIPEDYFPRLAYEIADGYMIFGNFMTLHYHDENIKTRNAEKASFELPVMFRTIPDEVTRETIDIGFGIEKYRVLKYYKNSVVIHQKTVVKAADNVEYLTQLAFEGKLDNMDYDRIPIMYNVCKIMNAVGLRVPAYYEEVIFSTTYRDLNKPELEARYTAKSKGTRVAGLRLREKAPISNTFSGISFEDKISMFTIAHNKKKEGKIDAISDVERFSLGLD